MLSMTIVKAHTTHWPENQSKASGQMSATTDDATIQTG
jgi:hypothetical protein